jgi:hypothetical protein
MVNNSMDILATSAISIGYSLNALNDKSMRGIAPREALEQALPLISGVDSAVLVKTLKNYLKAIPYDNGWVRLFNGKNLNGWKGLVGNPISRAKMTEEEFYELKTFFNGIKDTFFRKDPAFKEVSMGMSGDYKLAIAKGSTLIRLGSTIFGGRQLKAK